MSQRERLPESLWPTVGVWRATTAKGATELQHNRGSAYAEAIVAGDVPLATAQREHDAAERIAEAIGRRGPTLADAFPEVRRLNASPRLTRPAVDAWTSALKGRRVLEGTR